MESEWIEAALAAGRYVTDTREKTVNYSAAVLTIPVPSVFSRSFGEHNRIISIVE